MMEVENLGPCIVQVKGSHVDQKDIAGLLEPLCPKIDKQVFIKPNLAVPADSASGIVTDVRLVGSLVDFLRSKGVDRICIG